MLKKYILTFFICFSLFICSFTSVTFADTPLFELKPSSIYNVEFPDGAFNSPLSLGRVFVDGVYATDFEFRVNYGANSVLFFRFVPCSYLYDGDTAALSYENFYGYKLRFELPIYEKAPGEQYGAYTTYEVVELTIGADYGGTNIWTSDNVILPGTVNLRRIDSQSQFIFVIDARYITYDTAKFSGSYSNYTGLDLLQYICATLKALEAPLVDGESYVSTNFVFDVNYFPELLSYADREQLGKLDDINDTMTQVDGTLNDIKDVLNQSPTVPIEPPPEYDIPDTGEDKFLDDADKVLDDLNNYKDSILNQFPDVNDNLFGSSASVIRAFVFGSFDTFTYRITDSSAGVDFSPVMTIIYLSFMIGVIALLRG